MARIRTGNQRRKRRLQVLAWQFKPGGSHPWVNGPAHMRHLSRHGAIWHRDRFRLKGMGEW